MLFQQQISSIPFKQWIWQEKENRQLLMWAGIVIIIQFAIFKFLYPFPNFMPPDSTSYLEAAWSNQLINTWAIGYSKFLRFVSSFTNSHFALVTLQYFFFQASVLYLAFTIRYLLRPARWIFIVLLFANILNPLLPHISNFVSSDSLFTSLSIVWFTQLLWMLYKPTRNIIISHAFVLLLAFMVRYNALYYPLLSIAVIIISDLSLKTRLKSTALIIALLGSFIGVTEYEYYKRTGKAQYSPFGGWQIAANALYGYAHAKQVPVAVVPQRFQPLHALVNRHMDSINQLRYRPDNEVAVYYLWDYQSPLRKYIEKGEEAISSDTAFNRWASVAPLYSDYGKYLIKKHPFEFIKFYLWPNFLKYYAPPTKFMGSYNMGIDSVELVASAWFGWKSKKLMTFFKNKKIKITEPFQVLSGIINFVFIISFLSFIVLSGFSKINSLSKRIFWLMVIIWFSNMLFSVFAAPIELRYQLFPLILTYSFMLLFISFVVKESRTKEEKRNNVMIANSTDIGVQLS